MPKNYNFKNVEHFPFGINSYVPQLQGLADHAWDYNYLVDFGAPVPADDDAIIAAGGPVGTVFSPGMTASAGFAPLRGAIAGIDGLGVIDAPWGRDVSVTASGAGTNSVTITGYDYLGQRVVKTRPLAGASAVSFGAAFKRIESINVAAGGAITVKAGFGGAFGLPYRCGAVVREWADGQVAAAGTLSVAASTTDPQTAATTDPRGLYTPATTPDGVLRIVAALALNPFINDAGNGGLHGFRHFGG